MKYTLRSLMIVVTLVCVLLGGRIEYLRQMANFHAKEADSCDLARKRLRPLPFNKRVVPSTVLGAQQDAHKRLADEYSAAISRPWSIIRAPQPPANFDEWFQQLGKGAEAEANAP
jgi:hypothetical protein